MLIAIGPGKKKPRPESRQGECTRVRSAFRKELNGDRLEIALHYREVSLPGGTRTTDPHKMASASVSISLPFRHCTDGRQIHLLRRYQFGPAEESGQEGRAGVLRTRSPLSVSVISGS